MAVYTTRHAEHSNTYYSEHADRTAPQVERLARRIMRAFMGSPSPGLDLLASHPSEKNGQQDVLAEKLTREYESDYATIARSYRGLVDELLPGINSSPSHLRKRTGLLEGESPMVVEVIDSPASTVAQSHGGLGLAHKEIRTIEPYGTDTHGRSIMRETRYREHPTSGRIWYDQVDHLYEHNPHVPVASRAVPVQVPLVQEGQMEELNRMADAARWNQPALIPDHTRA